MKEEIGVIGRLYLELSEMVDVRSLDESRYDDIVLSVERVFPGEKRHETALRYVREAEKPGKEGRGMKVWALRPVVGLANGDDPCLDKAKGFVVIARTEAEARAMAHYGAWDRNEPLPEKEANHWLEQNCTTCTDLATWNVPGVVMMESCAAQKHIKDLDVYIEENERLKAELEALIGFKEPLEPIQSRLPKLFVELGLEVAEGSSIFGKLFSEMTRDELIATSAQGWKRLMGGRFGEETALELNGGLGTGWELLLAKYVAHVSAAEGESFALSTEISPCGMLEFEFTQEEKKMLSDIFMAVKKYNDSFPRAKK